MLDFVERLPNWQKYGAVGLVVALIIGLFYNFSYKEKRVQIEKLTKEIAQLDRQILEAQATAARLEEFRMELAMVRARLKSTMEYLPHGEEMPDLITTIQGLAAQSGLNLRRFLPQGPRNYDFYGDVPIVIEAYGGYHEFGEFFEEIANERRIVNVVNLTMDGTSQVDDTVRSDFTAVAFFFKPEVPPPAPPGPPS